MSTAPQAATQAQLQAVIRHLDTASLPPLPQPPKGRIRLLLWSIQAFVLSTLLLTPLVAAALLALPLAYRYLSGERLPSGLGMPLWVAAIALMLAWGKALRSREQPRPPLREFDRADSPELFALLDAVADCVGTERVAQVSMSPGDGFAVSEARPRWWGGAGALHLRLEWNDLNASDLTEVTGILLHEFAHYGLGHTAAARKLYRRARFLFALERRLAADSWTSWNPVYFWVRSFVRWFDRRYAAISRIEEAQADAVAVGLVGAEAFMKGLEKAYRNGLETSGRINYLIDEALSRAELDTDILGAMAQDELSGEDKEAFEAHLKERMEESLHPEHSHPPFMERCAQAIRMRDAGEVVPGVAALPRGASAYALFFDLPALRCELSAAVLGAAARQRNSAVGLRGELSMVAGLPSGASAFAPRYHAAVRSATMLFCGLGALLTGGIAWLSYERPAEFGENWPLLALMALVQVYVVVAAFCARRSGLQAGPEGLEWRRAFSTRSVGWEEVQGIRCDDRGPRVLLLDGSKIRVGGQALERDALVDVVLERAPGLQILGWGVGLSRVAEPEVGVELPRRVTEDASGLLLEGPGRNLLRFGEQHPAYGAIREALETRLLPRMDSA